MSALFRKIKQRGRFKLIYLKCIVQYIDENETKNQRIEFNNSKVRLNMFTFRVIFFIQLF